MAYCCTYLKISVVSGFIKKAGFFLLLYPVLGNMLFWLKYVRKIQPHTVVPLEKQGVF